MMLISLITNSTIVLEFHDATVEEERPLGCFNEWHWFNRHLSHVSFMLIVISAVQNLYKIYIIY